MTKDKSIQEIKQEIAQIYCTTDARLLTFEKDARKSVQKIVQTRQKQLEKKEKLKQKYQEMNVYEQKYLTEGKTFIAGLDEVGRGPLAGPVVASAVILDPKKEILGLNDSKQLSEKKREMLCEEIKEKALYYAIGEMSAQKIDEVNILEATKLAMLEALHQLPVKPDVLLIDALNLEIDIPQEKIIKGDTLSNSIAAASILAKVTRDKWMGEYARKYPVFDFEKNAGYGTKKHLDALKEFGKTPIHRESFAPVKQNKKIYKK